MKGFVCSVISVSSRGAKLETSLRKTSPREVGEAEAKAILRPSWARENSPAIKRSGPVMRVIFLVPGSTRKRWEAVFCNPEK